MEPTKMEVIFIPQAQDYKHVIHVPVSNLTESGPNTDETEFRNLIVWIEDQKIRHYKIEDREAIRKISAGNWEEKLQNYLNDLGCPYPVKPRVDFLDWLLGYAVRLEYGDTADKYKAVTAVKQEKKGKGDNPLNSLDFDSPDFKAGVASLALLLQLPPYQDHLVVLKAVSLLVKERMNKNAIEAAKKQTKESENLTLDKIPLGFETGDYISAEAAKILRLLHIRELRDLQTSINEAIVKVQTLTANPKTDTRLGKVGVVGR